MWLDCPEPALQAVWAMCLIEAVQFLICGSSEWRSFQEGRSDLE